MRHVAPVLVLAAQLLGIAAFDAFASAPQPPPGTIMGTVRVRERSDKDESLLVAVTGAAQKPVTRLEVTLPDDYDFRVGHTTTGWKATIDGKRLRAEGPPSSNVHLRFDIAVRENILKKLSGKKCRTRAWSGDELVFGIEHAILPEFKVGTQYTLADALALPPIVAENDPFVASPSAGFSENGTWQLYIEDTEVPAIEPRGAGGSWHLRFSANPTVEDTQIFSAGNFLDRSALFVDKASPGLRFVYTDPFGDVQINSKPDWTVTPPGSACTGSLSGGASLAFAGKPACVTGCFDGLGASLALLFDDKEPLQPLAVSRSSIVLMVPSTAPAGPHTVSLREGKASLGTHTFKVIHMIGSIDQKDLWTGQSTKMQLAIDGHDQPLPLLVVNRTPFVINVDGGVRQTVTTSGGTPNGASRGVKGTMKGDFQIDFTLNLPPCGSPR
jgi:hypothetical protein